MPVLVTYDVNTLSQGDKKRLRRVARACLDCGQKVQSLLFEIASDPAQWAGLKARLEDMIGVEQDCLRQHCLVANGVRRVNQSRTAAR